MKLFGLPLPDVPTLLAWISVLAAGLAVYRTFRSGKATDESLEAKAKKYTTQAAADISEGVNNIIGPLNARNEQLSVLVQEQAAELLRRDDLHKSILLKFDMDHKAEIRDLTNKLDAVTQRLTDSEYREKGMRHGIQVLIAQLESAGIKAEYNPTPDAVL